MLAPMVVRWGGFQFGAERLMKAVCFRVCGAVLGSVVQSKKPKRLDKHRSDQKRVTVGKKGQMTTTATMIMIMMIIIIVPLIGNTETHNLKSAAVFLL